MFGPLLVIFRRTLLTSTSPRAATATAPSSSAFQSLFGPSFYSFPRYRKMELPALTEEPSSWKGSSLLSVNQITPLGLHLLFAVAQEMRSLVWTKGGDKRLEHKIVSTVFYEASTRTACSFQAAMMRLGGSHVSHPNATWVLIVIPVIVVVVADNSFVIPYIASRRWQGKLVGGQKGRNPRGYDTMSGMLHRRDGAPTSRSGQRRQGD